MVRLLRQCQVLEQSAPPNMVWIPGGTFRMGWDKHYPKKRPSTDANNGVLREDGRMVHSMYLLK